MTVMRHLNRMWSKWILAGLPQGEPCPSHLVQQWLHPITNQLLILTHVGTSDSNNSSKDIISASKVATGTMNHMKLVLPG